MHDGDRHAVYLGQVNEWADVLAPGPVVQRDGLLEAALDGDLVEVQESVRGSGLQHTAVTGFSALIRADWGAVVSTQRASVIAIEIVDTLLSQLEVQADLSIVIRVLRIVVLACGQTHKSVDTFSIIVLILGESVEDLRATRRVAHQRHFRLLGNFDDFIDESRDVVGALLTPVEVPVLLDRPRVIINVAVTVLCATIIAHPDVVTAFGECAGKCRIAQGIATEPGVRILTSSMLEEDGWLAVINGHVTLGAGDPEQSKEPSILRLHSVWFPLEAQSFAIGGPFWIGCLLFRRLRVCSEETSDGSRDESSVINHFIIK